MKNNTIYIRICLYILIIFIIIHTNVLLAKNDMSLHSSLMTTVIKKICIKIAERNVQIYIDGRNIFILNNVGKRIFINLLSKIASMKIATITIDNHLNNLPPRIMPDVIVDIYLGSKQANKLLIQILYFSGNFIRKSKIEHNCLFITSFDIDEKEIPNSVISIWGDEARILASEIEAIYKKQQQSPSK